jgi:hypothetical protein
MPGSLAIGGNADPIWLQHNELWECMDPAAPEAAPDEDDILF